MLIAPRKLDWSKHGAIACVTPNGKGVQTHVLIRSQKSAKWKLSKAIPIPLDLDDSANNIVHVCWNYLGNELAAIDSSGRIFIFNTPGVLGRLTPLRSGMSDPDTELNGIAAMYWLPIAQFANKVFMSANRTGSSWAYNREKLNHVMGPTNPIDRQGGLLALTRMGVLRLLYQGPNGKYMERTQDLEVSGLTVDNAITHAAFAPHLGKIDLVSKADNLNLNRTEQNLLLTTYDSSCSLRVYQVGIKWNPEPTPEGQKPQSVNPILEIAPLILEENVPPNPAGSDEQNVESSNGYIGPSLAMSHLEIMPALQTAAMKQPLSATIMAVFTPVSPSSAVLMDPNNHFHSTTSTVCRWFIKQGNGPRLLPVFDELKSKGQRSASSVEPRVSRHPNSPNTSLNF
jgi:mediator of RNA polymerase II transcription subunit 16